MKNLKILMPAFATLFAFAGAFASTLEKASVEAVVDVSYNNPCTLVGTCVTAAGPLCEDASGNDLWLYSGGTCPTKLQGHSFDPL